MLPAVVSTSGRIHGDFLRLLYILADNKTKLHFRALDEAIDADSEAFCWRRSGFFWRMRASASLGLSGGCCEAIDVDSEAYFGNIAPGAFFVTKREGTAKSVQLIHNDGLSSTPRCLPDSDDARVPALTGDHHLFNLKLPPLYCCGVHGGLHTAASGRQETLAPHPGNGPLSRGHTCRAPRLSSCWAPRPAACNC